MNSQFSLFVILTAAMLVAMTLPADAASSSANPYVEASQLPVQTELPDPLIQMNGRRVTSKREWVNQRRPELKQLFQHYMYGQLPPAPAKIEFSVERVDKKFFGGKATKKEVWISFGSTNQPRIHLLVVTPNGRTKPVPVFLGMNFCGNHAVVNDPTMPISPAWFYNSCKGCTNNHATEASRGSELDNWAIEQSIDRGYAVATFYSGDVVPDIADAIDAARAQLGSPDCGAIAAWAWGFHRGVDYLVTDRAIDTKRIAVVGHSRNGKTALLAAALDERIALAIPLQAGCGGTAPSRGKVGESVKQINDRFPHWFNAEFKKFNEQPERLPFDQHALIALVAPRPVLLANATEDQWANPDGQFTMLQAADPVYRLLKAGGLNAARMPETGRLIDSPLGYYIRPGKHSMTRDDWKVFLDFADKHFGRSR